VLRTLPHPCRSTCHVVVARARAWPLRKGVAWTSLRGCKFQSMLAVASTERARCAGKRGKWNGQILKSLWKWDQSTISRVSVAAGRVGPWGWGWAQNCMETIIFPCDLPPPSQPPSMPTLPPFTSSPYFRTYYAQPTSSAAAPPRTHAGWYLEGSRLRLPPLPPPATTVKVQSFLMTVWGVSWRLSMGIRARCVPYGTSTTTPLVQDSNDSGVTEY
jgi:hypothetical protein